MPRITNPTDPKLLHLHMCFKAPGSYQCTVFYDTLVMAPEHGVLCVVIGSGYDDLQTSRHWYYGLFDGWCKAAGRIVAHGIDNKLELDEKENVGLLTDICEALSALGFKLVPFNTREGGAGRCKPTKDRTARVYLEGFTVAITQLEERKAEVSKGIRFYT